MKLIEKKEQDVGNPMKGNLEDSVFLQQNFYFMKDLREFTKEEVKIIRLALMNLREFIQSH